MRITGKGYGAKLPAVVMLVAMLGGCGGKTVVTGLPPNVTNAQVNAWVSASNFLKQLSDGTHAIQVSVITANRNGFFKDGDAYVATLTAIGKADAIELQATQFLQSVPNSFGQPIQTQLMAFTQQILAQLNLASSQLGVPKSIVTNIAQAISLAIQIEQLIQSFTARNCMYPNPCDPIPAIGEIR